jgi:DNA-binding transcriptional MerR regulator
MESETVLELNTTPAVNGEAGVFDDPELIKAIDGIPDKMAFKIGEVADIAGVQPYVLRYWETEFDELRPKKSDHNQRMYTRHDVKMVLMIRKLLHKDRFSIEGARKALRRLRTEVKKETKIRDMSEKSSRAVEQLQDVIDEIAVLRGLFTV